MKATKRQLSKEVEAIGGYWDQGFDTLDSPEGMVWTSMGDHSIVMVFPYGEPVGYTYGVALESVRMGVEVCKIAECEFCN